MSDRIHAAGAEVIAVSVAAAAVQRRFVAAVRAVTGRPPRLCGSQRLACGVRNGYADVWRLGADRWIALLGARQAPPSPPPRPGLADSGETAPARPR